MLVISGWKCTDLHLLAQLPDCHGLPALDLLHVLEEQARGTFSVHIASDVLVVPGALLEDADGVVVGANTVMLDLHRLRNGLVGEDFDGGL